MTSEDRPSGLKAATPDRPRHGRDWSIAAGSLVPIIGFASPLYLAWRDGRRFWMAVGGVLAVINVAAFFLTDASDDVSVTASAVGWLGSIVVATFLAATVPEASRRSSAREIAARRGTSHREWRVAGLLAAAEVGPEDPRPRDRGVLVEPVVLIAGSSEAGYVVHDRRDRPLGQLRLAPEALNGCAARYELSSLDGALLLALHVADSRAGANAIVDDEGEEIVRLEPADAPPRPPDDPLPGARVTVLPQGLGFGPMRIVGDHGSLGLLAGPRGRRGSIRVITDVTGDEVARLHCAAKGEHEHEYVAVLGEAIDMRLRAVALLTAALWDRRRFLWIGDS